MTDLFSFHGITEDEIRKEISKLDGSEATPVWDIPAEMLKSTADVHASLLTKIINSCIRNGCFPDELKAAEVTCVKDHWKGHVHTNWKFHGRQVTKIAYRFQKKPKHPTSSS